ncbi:hypothetical protein DFH07DRAFT_771760 [Mycena maculata]|uniref:Uncharacterized protein n=1 Tax=Mycena maculata TaxID=230809 RepID=A0AAD7NHI6_9AGAR|nr:hypothetical protein DFH07DRAFT_771760 [Mycena maculata]
MLKLGRKYEIAAFRDDAVSRLHHDYPTQFEDWDRLFANTELRKIQHADQAELLNLACETGVSTCIPALGLECLYERSLEQLFSGIDSQITLPNSTKVMLALAAELLHREQGKNFEWLRKNYWEDHCEACADEEKNSEDGVIYYLKGEVPDISGTVFPWNKVASGHWVDRLCEDCENLAKAEWECCRKKLWERLPTFFGLPAWKDLKDDD